MLMFTLKNSARKGLMAENGCVRESNMVITVTAADLAPSGARPPTDTVLIVKLG